MSTSVDGRMRIEIDPQKPPMNNGPWRYIVKAEYDGVKVTVAKFWTKREAKALRNKLRERYPEADFYLGWDAPRPRWKEMKSCLNADRSSRLIPVARENTRCG